MNGKHIQQMSRALSAFLLVILTMAVTAIPALAWQDAGGSGVKRQPVALDDEQMGYLSLTGTRRPAVAPEAPAIGAGGGGAYGEETGFFSLGGAHYVGPTGGQPARINADDEAMGYLSLKVAGQLADNPEPPNLAQGP